MPMRRFLIVLVVLAGTGVPAVPARAVSGLVEEPRLASGMTAATRFLRADEPGRRLYEIGQPTGGSGMRVDVRDLDSLARLGSVVIPNAASGLGGGLAATDVLRHRLFVVYPVATAGETRTVFG